MTCGYYCDSLLASCLWFNNLASTCVRFWTITELWLCFNFRKRRRVNRDMAVTGGWCNHRVDLSLVLQAVLATWFAHPADQLYVPSLQFKTVQYDTFVKAWEVKPIYWTVAFSPVRIVSLSSCRHLHFQLQNGLKYIKSAWWPKGINPLALELDIYSLAHHLCKMLIFY